MTYAQIQNQIRELKTYIDDYSGDEEYDLSETYEELEELEELISNGDYEDFSDYQ